MKRGWMVALLLGCWCSGAARADTTRPFVRIACVPEAGLLSVEAVRLHDSVAIDGSATMERQRALAYAGFHAPHGLAVACVLGGVHYRVSAQQDAGSQRICGADPEVYLTVQRDGAAFIDHVIFGARCNGLPAVAGVVVGDGPQSWRGRETQVCHTQGADAGGTSCDWTFGPPAAFASQFPIDQQRVAARAARQVQR